MKKENKKSFWKNTKAVSPVIGVILMVAVTVVMAAIIMNWSSSISAPETPKQCGISVSRINTTHLRATVTSIVPVGATINYINYTNDAGDETIVFNNNDESIVVGCTNNNIPLSAGRYTVFIVEWGDTTKDILFDTKI